MAHPLVQQLRFTRKEFIRGIKGVPEEDARKRLLPVNCISWNVGHLAAQEQRYFLRFGQGKMLLPEIDKDFGFGAPASAPRWRKCWPRGKKLPPLLTRGWMR